MHQDHHTSNTSVNTDSKTYQMFYTDLDLWTLTVDQLKQHMKDLGIYHGCSKLRKEELIERIKEFNHPHEHDHHGEKRKHDEHDLKKEELSPKKEKVDDSVFEEDLLHPHSFDDLSLTMKGEESMPTPHPHKSNEHRKRRFVSSCPIKTKERIERALTQKYVHLNYIYILFICPHFPLGYSSLKERKRVLTSNHLLFWELQEMSMMS